MQIAPATWLLLIYTVPAEPSRKRAAIWRDLKKAGALYLRDGVCALPEREDTLTACRAVAARVEEYGGQAIVAREVRLDPDRAQAVVSQACAARADEYSEIAREAERLLQHLRRERDHRDFRFAELEGLEADLGKLKRWREQVLARDYFSVQERDRVQELLVRCEEQLSRHFEEASGMGEAGR